MKNPSNKVKHIPAGEFKAKCLKLMDQVNESQHEVVITKHGKPVATCSVSRDDAERVWIFERHGKINRASLPA